MLVNMKLKNFTINQIINHNGKSYIITDDEPMNGDLVITDDYGVWEYKNENGSAPLPYWSNKDACMKLKLIK